MAYPTQRVRIEVEENGQKMLIIISGEKGKIYIHNTGFEPLSADEVKRCIDQFDILSNLKWDAADYDLKLLKSQLKEGKKYDIIEAKEKKGNATIQAQTFYFDNATGLLASIEFSVRGGNPEDNGRTIFENYKTAGKYVYPSEIRMLMAGKETDSIMIDTLVFDYPITDEMFAEPK